MTEANCFITRRASNMSYFGTLRAHAVSCALLSSIVGAISPLAPAQAQTAPKRDTCGAIDRDLLDARSIFRYGVTPEDLQERFYGSTSRTLNDGSYNDDGYRPVRLTGYMDDGNGSLCDEMGEAWRPQVHEPRRPDRRPIRRAVQPTQSDAPGRRRQRLQHARWPALRGHLAWKTTKASSGT